MIDLDRVHPVFGGGGTGWRGVAGSLQPWTRP
jgi:hypothetical protein